MENENKQVEKDVEKETKSEEKAEATQETGTQVVSQDVVLEMIKSLTEKVSNLTAEVEKNRITPDMFNAANVVVKEDTGNTVDHRQTKLGDIDSDFDFKELKDLDISRR